jgi:hypothetical protein
MKMLGTVYGAQWQAIPVFNTPNVLLVPRHGQLTDKFAIVLMYTFHNFLPEWNEVVSIYHSIVGQYPLRRIHRDV